MNTGPLPNHCRLDAGLRTDPKAVRLLDLIRGCSTSDKVWLTTSDTAGDPPPTALCSARSKLARLGLEDSPTAFQWVSKHERSVDWNRIRTTAALRRAAAAEFEAASQAGRYVFDPDATGGSALAHLAALRTAAERNPAAASALAVYEADPAGHWARVVALLNRQRLGTVREWRAYLTSGNDAYAEDPFWQACAWEIVHAALNGDRNHGLGILVPLHKGALAALRQSLETEARPVSFHRRYGRLRAEYARLGGAALPAGGERTWVYIPSKTEAKRKFRENVERLQALSCPTWCTKSYNAERYLERGGFWLLLEGNTAIAAVRLVGRTVAEIQGVKNDGRLPPEAAAEIDALLASRSELEGAAVWRVRNPDATDARLAALAAGASAEVALLAARHPNAGAQTLALLAGSEHPEALLAVAKHPNTPAATLHRLAAGPNPQVLVEVTRHPRVTVETLVRLGGVDLNGVQAAVALHPATPATLLTSLAAARSKLVRGSAAGNPNTPPATLTRLAEDEYYGVRGDVARNPNTPGPVLALLLEDEHPYVRGQAMENPNTPRGSISARIGLEAYYEPETDTCVFLLDRIESVERAAALFFHEHTHRLLVRLARSDGGRAAKRLLLTRSPRLIADLPGLLRRSGHETLGEFKLAYGFGERAADRLALLGELLARQAERLAEGDLPPAALAERARGWWEYLFGRPPK